MGNLKMWLMWLLLVLSNAVWADRYVSLLGQHQRLLEWNKTVETQMVCRYIGADWDCQQRGGH